MRLFIITCVSDPSSTKKGPLRIRTMTRHGVPARVQCPRVYIHYNTRRGKKKKDEEESMNKKVMMMMM